MVKKILGIIMIVAGAILFLGAIAQII